MHHLKFVEPEMKDCIELCNECRDECETVLYRHCLKIGGKHADQSHVKLMTDCIESCQTAAHFMLRGSDNFASICNACAEICDLCADSCAEIGDKEMKDCAETCRKCAESCREMSGKKMGMSGANTKDQGAGMMA